MNSAIVSKTKTKSLPNFPVLSVGKTKRVFTRHFCNLALWLSPDEFALLSFLVYSASADNTIKYSTRLLEKFIEAGNQALCEYVHPDCENLFSRNLILRRKSFVSLVEKGLLLHTAKRHYFLINPMLTYESQIINNKQYEEFQKYYQGRSAEEITKEFTILAASFLESKKPNYKYGKKKS